MSAFVPRDRYFDPESGRLSAYFSRLFILIGQESLQYSILDTENNRFVALADFHLASSPKTPEIFYAELSELMKEEDALKKRYPSVIIGIDTPVHTLVPLPLYDPGQSDKYLELNFGLKSAGKVRTDRLEEIGACNVYWVPQPLSDIIAAHYSEAALFHCSSAFINAVCNHQKINSKHASLYLNVREHAIDLASLESGRLVLFNSYSCAGKEDMLYYTLYALEQLNLRPEDVHLHLSGMIDMDSESHQLLGQYIGQVTFSKKLDLWNYSPMLEQAPAHRYQELYALALCGS